MTPGTSLAAWRDCARPGRFRCMERGPGPVSSVVGDDYFIGRLPSVNLGSLPRGV